MTAALLRRAQGLRELEEVEANLEQRETELSLREEALQGLQAEADRIRAAVQVTVNQSIGGLL